MRLKVFTYVLSAEVIRLEHFPSILNIFDLGRGSVVNWAVSFICRRLIEVVDVELVEVACSCSSSFGCALWFKIRIKALTIIGAATQTPSKCCWKN